MTIHFISTREEVDRCPICGGAHGFGTGTTARAISASAGMCRVIRAQPGYRPGARMTLHRAVGGGLRLYVCADGAWMDGSLSDMSAE